MHNLLARRASLSSSCRCASKEEVCQTRGSPSQKCQRMSREPSGAGYKWGEKKYWRNRSHQACGQLRTKKIKTFFPSPIEYIYTMMIIIMIIIHKSFFKSCFAYYLICTVRLSGAIYLQSRPVHILRELSTPSVGDSEHFIWVHLYKRRDCVVMENAMRGICQTQWIAESKWLRE